MGGAKAGERALDLPPNSDTILECTGYTIEINKKNGTKTNGLLFAAIAGTVVSCTDPSLPIGAVAGVKYFGLNSPMNNGSLARECQEGLRQVTAALLSKDPNAEPFPGHTWESVCSKIASGNQALVIGKRFRVVTGPVNAQGFTKKQFFAVAV